MSTVEPIDDNELSLALMDDGELIDLVNTNPMSTAVERELATRLVYAINGETGTLLEDMNILGMLEVKGDPDHGHDT